MIFRYKGIDSSGKKINNKIEASTIDEAKTKLKAQGIIYTKIDEEKPSIFKNIHFNNRYKIPAKELSILSRELSMYIHSGITIVSALKIIQTHYDNNKKIKLFLTTISTYLDEGKDFYTSLEMQSIVELPEFFKHSIKVSEDSAILDEVLLELSRFLKEQDSINKEIKSAFTYPTFMIVVSLLMISFMLSFVVPQITGIFQDTHQTLPTPTIIVITLGDFFNENFTKLLGFIAITVSLFLFAIKQSQKFKYLIHNLLLKLPLFGKIIQKSELARFSYIASLLTRSGVPFVQTVNLSANTLDNLVLKESFHIACKQVVEGKHLSNALNSLDINIDYSFIQAIALGEETSELQNVLANISELYFEENRDKISTLLTLLEPTLMLFVGGTIGFIVAAMLLPIFSMSIN
jgi:general secretion pathway protein F/type IV pilus assembly protein PilC